MENAGKLLLGALNMLAKKGNKFDYDRYWALSSSEYTDSALHEQNEFWSRICPIGWGISKFIGIWLRDSGIIKLQIIWKAGTTHRPDGIKMYVIFKVDLICTKNTKGS